MKKLYFILALMVIPLGFYIASNEKARRMKLAENSFSTGCYQFARHYCNGDMDEENRAECYEDALEFCPAQAKKFREWIEGGTVK